MARKFLTAVDLSKNELQNVRIQNLASAPSSPVPGQMYYDTTVNKLYWYNGTTWIDAMGDEITYATTAELADVDAAAESAGTSTTVPRGDHKHAAAVGTPGNSAPGDVASAGTATTLARSDHKHGRENHGSAEHSSIPLSALAAPTTNVSFNSQKITNLADPTAAQDAATKAYVDAVKTGLDVKDSVRAATTGNITLSGTQTIDGVALAVGDRVLVKDQTTASQNGIYVVASGAWSRAPDADSNAEVTAGMYCFVTEGTTNGDTGWLLTTNDPITLGTTNLSFAQFTGGGGSVNAGAGLTKTGSTLDVGAGTGITVNADDVAVRRDGTNGQHVPLKYAADIGDGSSTSITVTHNLGTKDVLVALYDNSTPFAEVECDVEHTSTSAITLKFTNAPTSNQYRVVIFG
jgi:hypothetical protein